MAPPHTPLGELTTLTQTVRPPSRLSKGSASLFSCLDFAVPSLCPWCRLCSGLIAGELVKEAMIYVPLHTHTANQRAAQVLSCHFSPPLTWQTSHFTASRRHNSFVIPDIPASSGTYGQAHLCRHMTHDESTNRTFPCFPI